MTADPPNTEWYRQLLDLMATLRGPHGCPWDRAQTRESLRPYVLEEAYEVVEAIDRGDPGPIREELGDLLFQVVFQAQIGSEQEEFDMEAVSRSIVEKMRRRHPHVFGADRAAGEREANLSWELIKTREREAQGGRASVLDGVPTALPSLVRAARLSDKASHVGFDWPDLRGVLDKVHEEIGELEAAIGGDGSSVEHEYGDVLFALANLGRFLDLGPEDSLRLANERFIHRFQYVERELAEEGIPFPEAGLHRMEQAWQRAKLAERDDDPGDR